jgi:hypothetical protein
VREICGKKEHRRRFRIASESNTPIVTRIPERSAVVGGCSNGTIWAHMGMGRVIRPVTQHAAVIESILKDPQFSHVYFDISWDEVAKYLVATPESVKIAADLINRYPDRFLFGTDEVAPTSQQQYLRVYYQYDPLWKSLDREATEKVRKGNYERIFDDARERVRGWEQTHVVTRNSELERTTP